MWGRSKTILQNVSLGVGSVLFICLLCEFVLFRLFLPVMPPRLYGFVPEEVRVLAQSSKRFATPKDYIAVIGDSYAVGLGDWLKASYNNLFPEYQTTHVIHKKLKKDVLSFGQTGGESITNVVAFLNIYKGVNATRLFSIEEPKTIVVYFYEGNDLIDSISFLSRHFPSALKNKINDPEVYAAFMGKFIMSDRISSWKDNLFFFRFIKNIITSRDKRGFYISEKPPPGRYNKISIDGATVIIPDKLQSPALELTEEEIDLAVSVFEGSLISLSNRFPFASIKVVYIPSPLSSYELVSSRISFEPSLGRGEISRPDIVFKRSDDMREMIKEVAQKHSFDFVDSRPYIEKYSRRNLVHGPIDWNHFNKYGYLALAEAVLSILNEGKPAPLSTRPWPDHPGVGNEPQSS